MVLIITGQRGHHEIYSCPLLVVRFYPVWEVFVQQKIIVGLGRARVRVRVRVRGWPPIISAPSCLYQTLPLTPILMQSPPESGTKCRCVAPNNQDKTGAMGPSGPCDDKVSIHPSIPKPSPDSNPTNIHIPDLASVFKFTSAQYLLIMLNHAKSDIRHPTPWPSLYIVYSNTNPKSIL